MKSFTQFIFEKKNSRKGNTSGTKNTKGSGTGSIGGSEDKFRSSSGKVDSNKVRQTTSQVADTATNTAQGQKAFRDAVKDSQGTPSSTPAQRTKVKAKLDRYVQKDLFGDGADALTDRINPNQRYSRPATKGWTGGKTQPATKVSGKSFDQLKKEIDSKVDRRSTNKPPQGTQFKKRTKGGALATKQDLTPPTFKPDSSKAAVKDLKKNNKGFKKLFKNSLKTANKVKNSKIVNKGAKTFQKFASNPLVKNTTKFGGKLVGPAFAAYDVKGEFDDAKAQGRTNRGALTKAGLKVGAGYAGWGIGAKTGAATGAALGSFVGPVGTAVGGAVGGIAGGLTGYWAGSKLAGSTYDKVAGPTQKQKDAVANAQVAITKAKEKKKLKTGVYLNTGKYS